MWMELACVELTATILGGSRCLHAGKVKEPTRWNSRYGWGPSCSIGLGDFFSCFIVHQVKIVSWITLKMNTKKNCDKKAVHMTGVKQSSKVKWQ